MGAQESKLSFRRGVFRLHEEHDIPLNDPYWQSYWTLPESAEDIFTLFSAADIRKARDESPENIETLIRAIVNRLITLRHDPRFPCENVPEREMLNCLRILTRLIPFLFEIRSDDSRSTRFLWSPIVSGEALRSHTTHSDDSSGEEVTPTNELPGRAQARSPSWSTLGHGEENGEEEEQPMAEALMQILIELLFFCGFTIPASYGNEKVVYGIWETGVGCTSPMGTSRQFESNKIEVLRCLLALVSEGMYVPANEARDNRHITHLVMMIPKNVVLALLCSLINTTMKFNPTTWRTIPYSSNFLSDSRQLLVSYSLQFLLVVLCYPVPRDGAQTYHGQIPDGESAPVNQFRHYFKKLHRANDFNFMVEGMSRVLQQPLSASTAYLPGSQKPIRFYPEMLLFFWEALQQNKRFRSFLIETDRALDFLVVLLFYALEHKTDPVQIGLVRMCVFILQPLSAEPKFAKSLNRQFEGQASLPASVRIPSFTGTYADFLIISIYSLIATSKGQLSSLYAALFMTLSNIAPYTKNMSVVASTKLVQLFTSISQPSFLFANDSNFKLLQYVLEVLNSVIQHNFNANPHLIYAILRSHNRFESLQDLTLSSGIESVSNLKKAKVQREQERLLGQEGAAEPQDDQSLSGTVQQVGAPGTIQSQPASTADSGGPQDAMSVKNAAASSGIGSRTNAADSRKSSLSSDFDFPPPSPRVMSEKARGKLPEGVILNRQNSASSIQSTKSLTGTQLGPKVDFDPSESWFETWFPDLEMGSIVSVLNQMAGEVTRLSQETPDPRPIVKFLQKVKLESVIAQTPNPRSFVWSEQAKVWFESLLFGYIYISETQIGNGAVGVWTGTHVKLFKIQTDSSAGDSTIFFKLGQGVDTVANTLAGKFSNATLTNATP